jgi:Domain of unknown function (DUF6766)
MVTGGVHWSCTTWAGCGIRLARRDDSGTGVQSPSGEAIMRKRLRDNGLSLTMFGLFLLSFLGHAASGTKHYNEDQHAHGQPPVSMLQYVATARFWFGSFQNWQSEFLAMGALAVLSIWLREQGSPESKPVHSAHDDTGR